MTWLELLHDLDTIRARIRGMEVFQKSPRAQVPMEVADWFREISAAVENNTEPAKLTIELDSDGKPIVPKDLENLFKDAFAFPTTETQKLKPATVAEAGRTPRKHPPASDKPEAQVLPRETHRVERPPNIITVDEASIAPDEDPQ